MNDLLHVVTTVTRPAMAPGLWYTNDTQTTIAKAGRVVIPARVRERAGVRPGTRLEVVLEGSAVRLAPTVRRPRLVQRGGRWIAAPTAPPTELPQVDIAALVEEERDRWPL